MEETDGPTLSRCGVVLKRCSHTGNGQKPQFVLLTKALPKQERAQLSRRLRHLHLPEAQHSPGLHLSSLFAHSPLGITYKRLRTTKEHTNSSLAAQEIQPNVDPPLTSAIQCKTFPLDT